jgi:hypothetical protein
MRTTVGLASLILIGWTCGLPATEPAPAWDPGLSDRELAISRWFSQLTYLQDRASQPWPRWHDDGKQLGITGLRYQLAFAGYGCAAMAARTPAYRQLAAQQLGDLCERLIDARVWYYVTRYWKYGDEPPDPCRYENVMYTGHLTHLMCLYELLTGDTRYSDAGWDFAAWDGRRLHYTLRQAVERLHVQSVRSPHGGICCEPNLVFATCNSHSAASFLLFDLLHGTQYADVNQKWFTWMARNFRRTEPTAPEFFYRTYHQDRVQKPLNHRGKPGGGAQRRLRPAGTASGTSRGRGTRGRTAARLPRHRQSTRSWDRAEWTGPA